MVEEISGVMWLLFASKLQIDVFSYLRAYVNCFRECGQVAWQVVNALRSVREKKESSRFYLSLDYHV